ncbi:MAG: hypothetical protein ACK4ND_11480 [Cytophagaceae bacterium]
MNFLLLVFFSILTVSCNVQGNKSKLRAVTISANDSLDVSRVVTEFYEWYIDVVKTRNHSEYQPVFTKSKEGIATLDYSVYIENLKKHHFSDSFIKLEKESYEVCKNNLEKHSFSEFESNFTDLDHFEETSCDFGNYYRWTGGQEPIDGIRINKVEFSSKGKAVVYLSFFIFSKKDESYYWGNTSVTLAKQKNKWKITGIAISI